MRVQVQQGREPAIQLSRPAPFAPPCHFPEILVFLRESDPASRHPAVDPQNRALEHQVIHSGENGVAISNRVVQIGDAPRIRRTLFERNKIFLIGQSGKQLGRNVVAVADGVVVNHDRQPGGARDASEVSR